MGKLRRERGWRKYRGRLSHQRKRTITDSNRQKRTPPFGVERDDDWCGWLVDGGCWQYACQAEEMTLEPPIK